MPETRTFDPAEGDDLAKLVRDAIGGNVRPNEPGTAPSTVAQEDGDANDGSASLVDLPDFDF
ncbi:hypothetical protein [uncultured Tessaracoccus sp.]|uniref:hypothetical protein n=1 Tax=uncultured Tessaracoccus sp. TaxID=905023 RepID=UPI002632177F|nr:hypothetical protein [uncultured Tessaracoccus sp.]